MECSHVPSLVAKVDVRIVIGELERRLYWTALWPPEGVLARDIGFSLFSVREPGSVQRIRT